MLKTHCVTNLRASTQRCACCVLELLISFVFALLMCLWSMTADPNAVTINTNLINVGGEKSSNWDQSCSMWLATIILPRCFFRALAKSTGCRGTSLCWLFTSGVFAIDWVSTLGSRFGAWHASTSGGGAGVSPRRRAWICMVLALSFHPKVLRKAGVKAEELRDMGFDAK